MRSMAKSHTIRMEIGRPEFHIEIGDLSADPSLNDIVPGLIRPGDIALRRVLTFRRTAGSDDGGNTQHAQERQHGSTSHDQLLPVRLQRTSKRMTEVSDRIT